MTKNDAISAAKVKAKSDNTSICVMQTPDKGYQFCAVALVALFYKNSKKIATAHPNGNVEDHET